METISRYVLPGKTNCANVESFELEILVKEDAALINHMMFYKGQYLDTYYETSTIISFASWLCFSLLVCMSDFKR